MKNFPTSFFLYGPHGCGKTLIVQALAKEAGANFMHIKVLSFFAFDPNIVGDHQRSLIPYCVTFGLHIGH